MTTWEVINPYTRRVVNIVSLARQQYPYCVHLRRVRVGRYLPFPYDDALPWCEERFGPDSHKNVQDYNKCAWIHFGAVFMFKNSDHAIEFKVRWG